MTDHVARLVAESEIRRTIADYCHSCDDGRFDDFALCFAPDAVVVLGGKVVASGRTAIQAWIEKGQPPDKRGKHVTVNSLVTIDGAEARGATDFVFVARTPDGPQVTTAGRYLDMFAPYGDRWLFTSREIQLLR